MMTVLMADDDAAMRRGIRSALTKRVGCEIVEAHSGPDVLDKLQHQASDALVMDVQLPIIGGVETLQILRESPQFVNLPVFILTTEADEELVRRLIGLGVRDLFLKPLDAARMDRLTAALCLIEAEGGRPRFKSANSRLSESSSALIVDGDEAYRKYFKKAVRGRLSLTEINSGARALEVCHRGRPDVVFLGTNLGLIGRAQVARRLRAGSRGTVQIVAIPHKSDVDAERASGLFDDVMIRTYVPAAFDRELGRLLRATTTFDRLRDLVPDIRDRVIRAAEQVFGTMLGTDVEPLDTPGAGSEVDATASVTVTSPQFVVTVRVRFGLEAGRAIAAAFLETDASALPDDDILAVTGEVVNVLGGRLKAAFQEREIDTAMGLPVLAKEPAAQHPETIPPNEGVDIHFHAIDKPVTFRIQLTARPSEAASRAGAMDAESGVATIRTDG